MKRKTDHEQKPVAIGLLLCDQVIMEENTRNITLVNCFNHRMVDRIPIEDNQFIVFSLLTDGSGEMPLEVIVQRLDTFDVVYRFSQMVHFSDPLKDIRCTIRIRNCPFPVAGLYQVVLLVDKELIAQRKFAVLKKEKAE